MKKVLFPIRHALVFDWVFSEAPSLKDFNKASNLEDVAENLKKELFYSLNTRNDILVATSKAKPAVVTFTIIQRDAHGGEVILIQTHEGQYSLSELERNLKLFAKKAGIKFLKDERQLHPAH